MFLRTGKADLSFKVRCGSQNLYFPFHSQVHEVVDKLWLRGEGGGSVGLVPSSVLVKVELPPHPSHLPLFVASAEFLPSQTGDLGLARGKMHTR